MFTHVNKNCISSIVDAWNAGYADARDPFDNNDVIALTCRVEFVDVRITTRYRTVSTTN